MKKLAITYLAFFLYVALLAQPKQNLPSDQVEVVKNFEAMLAEAEKLNTIPSLPPLDTMRQRLNYSLQPRLMNITYEPPVIRPIAMKTEEPPLAFKGYTRLGYGYPSSPYLEASYHNKIGKNEVGVGVKHHSANNSKKLDNQRFGDTKIYGELTHYSEKGFALAGDVSYQTARRYFYGYNHDTLSFEPEDVRQHYSTFAAGGRFYNATRTQGDINYSANINFYQTSDAFDANEFGIAAELKATKFFGEKHPLTITITNDFSNYDGESEVGQALNNLSLAPSFTYHGEQFYAKAGLNLANAKDTFHFFPDVEVGYNVLNTALTAYVGWTGGLHKNSLRQMSAFNPFISSEYAVRNTSSNDIFGGIKGKIETITYQANVAYKIAKKVPLFIQNQRDTKRFDIVYDDMNTLNISIQTKAEVVQNLSVLAAAELNIFDTKTQEKAWHLQPFSVNFGVNYKMLQQKLSLRADAYAANGIAARNESGQAETLKPLLDLSLGAHYQFNKHIGLFLDANNLFNNKSQRWLHYPTIGINVLGGVTVRF